jgi:TolA-binding protein
VCSSDLPPAATLFQAGNASLLRNATGAARGSFQALVDNYPAHPLAPEAYVKLGISFAQEGNKTAADSVYALVPEKYPTSPSAATAVYKRAGLALGAKDNARYRALLQEVVDKYPKSDEAVVAQDLLKNLKP